MGDAVNDLVSITGLEMEQAAMLLEASGGNLEMAVQLHFDQQDSRGTDSQSAAAALAAQMEEDAYGHDDDVGADGEEGDGDDSGFPEPVRATSSPMMGAPPMGGGAGRPGGPPPSPLSRIYGMLGWLSYVPGYMFGLLQRYGVVSFLGSLLWAPLAMLGLVAPPARAQPPDMTIKAFEEWFEAEHGTTHPPFFRGTLYNALSRARSEAKFVLVYLHDAGSADCLSFCSSALSTTLVAETVDASFVLWVGDPSTQDGRRVERALRSRSGLPLLTVLSHGSMAAGLPGLMMRQGSGDEPVRLDGIPRTRCVDEGGQFSAEAVAAALHATVQRFEPMLVAARAEQNERETDRIMRTMQDDEYSRALAEDQAREEAEERQRLEEEERRHAEEKARIAVEEAEAAEAAAEVAKREARLAKGASLPEEPAADAAGVTRLVIKLPDGTRLDRRFDKACLLQGAIDFIESTSPEIYDFDLVQNYPRKVFTNDMRGQTLEELGLYPAVTLFTKEQDDD